MENSELITKALNYIKTESHKNDITIDDVAAHAGFSTDYFNRIFFAHTGFNIMQYVRFSRLKKAAKLLRVTSNNILDIALECGYEAHESFLRAFKNQYGMLPSEYRRKYENSEVYYGDFYNDTIASRLLHEFEGFKIADSDEVIDFLIEKDALRYGYIAVCFRINGGVALYNGESFKEGFVWFTEWNNRFEGEIVCDDWDKIAEYIRIFSAQRFEMILYTLKSDEQIKKELSNCEITISKINRRSINVYTDEPFTLVPKENIHMRLIEYNDMALVEKFYHKISPNKESFSPRLKQLKHQLYQRDITGSTDSSVFTFGIFKGDHLVGISDGGLQNVHGFLINNCVVTSVLPEYETEELYQYAFKFVTNAALEKGALPIDDIQVPTTPIVNKSGNFNSAELGYQTVTYACMMK
ncbi:MAG: helix-turn-helix transcriptional regulator [Ruminococcaceae bacterium]|nr:helix-turn-helix transcriptional regulator [Oscillospiraceae bacterium]